MNFEPQELRRIHQLFAEMFEIEMMEHQQIKNMAKICKMPTSYPWSPAWIFIHDLTFLYCVPYLCGSMWRSLLKLVTMQ